jgi:DNA adenine methylase
LFISDINPELILAYRTIQQAVEALITELTRIEEHYLPLPESQRKTFYYQQRALYNKNKTAIDYDTFQDAWIKRTAQLIFFNRTCYNGLFRVNSRGEYNVPFGRYKNPVICNGPNLRAVSEILQPAKIHYGHYTACADVVDGSTLVYFDPPYRPISSTANFTAYSPQSFDDDQQLELAEFYRQLHSQGAYLLLSNSDPKNTEPNDDFLEEAYQGFRIERVQARRRINRNADKRGLINELLILNY